MIVNADKFQVVVLNKKESEGKYKLAIDNSDIGSTKSVKLLGITIDNLLWFDQNIANLCSKAAMQLNALRSTSEIYGKTWKSFVYASFNFCPLVWHFSTCQLIPEIKKIDKRCLRIVLDNYGNDYDVLLKKNGKVTMEIKRLRVLTIEILKNSQ